MSEPTQPERGRMVLQMLGGAAITVAVLLPLYLIDRQSTNLAIAKLEMALAHVGAPAVAASPAAVPPAVPAPAAAPSPVVVVRSPPPTTAESELAQVTRTLSDLARRVEGLAPPGTAARTAGPADEERASRPGVARAAAFETPRSAESQERLARLVELRLKVYYESRCLGLVNEVAERLLKLHVNPELIETRQVRTGASRLVYMGDDQAAAAQAIADGLSSIIPVDIEPDTSGAAAGGPRLELTGAAPCQRLR